MTININVTITQEEFDLLEESFGVGSTQAWLTETLQDKIERRVDQSILDLTAYNPKKLNGMADKLAKLAEVTLPVREDKVK